MKALVLGILGALGIGVAASKANASERAPLDPFYRWDDLIHRYADSSRVPWKWVKAIMMNESSLGTHPAVARGLLNPTDVTGSASEDKKSWGLMQLTLPTARMFEASLTEADLNNPETSVRVAVKYLDWLYGKKSGDQEAVVRSYNGGPGYLTTAQGRRDTPEYYARFLRNLETINSKG